MPKKIRKRRNINMSNRNINVSLTTKTMPPAILPNYIIQRIK